MFRLWDRGRKEVGNLVEVQGHCILLLWISVFIFFSRHLLSFTVSFHGRDRRGDGAHIIFLELRLIGCIYVFRFILGDGYYHGQNLGMEVRSEIGFSPTLTSSANLDMLLASVSLTSPPCLVGDECMSLSATVQFKLSSSKCLTQSRC